MASKSKVYFFIDNVQIVMRQRKRLKYVVEALFDNEKKKLVTLNYIFCSDKALLKINQQYLQHNDYTDIITFNFSQNKTEVRGEAYISVDRIKDNATKLNIPRQKELYRVIFHGALHLCGYTDKTQKGKAIMREREDHYISLMD